MLGKTEDRRRRRQERVRWLDGITDSVDMSMSKLWEIAKDTEAWRGDSERHGSLACCSPWGGKESDTTQRLNNSNNCCHVITPTTIN